MTTVELHPVFARSIYDDLHACYKTIGAFGWLGQFIELQSKYAEVVSSIQCGVGVIARDEVEDPAKILAELRQTYDISASDYSVMMFYTKQLHEFECDVERIRDALKIALNKAGAPVEE